MRRFMLLTAVASLLFSTAALAQEDDDDDTSSEASEDDGASEDEPVEDASTEDEPAAEKEEKAGDDDDDDDKPKDETFLGFGSKGWGHDGKIPEESKPDVPSAEYRWDVHVLDFMTFGIGFLGGAGGNFLDKPGDQSVQGIEGVDPEYPGFAGLMTSVGPTFEFRFLGYVGVELDVLVQEDSGTADLKVTQTTGTTIRSETFTVEIRQSAIHMPLLFKGVIPGKIVSPALFLGPEFVFVSESSADITEGTVPGFHGVQYGAVNPDSYTAFMFGLGLEFNLPIPYIDARIPFNLRGTVNPGVSDKREERSDIQGTAPDNITAVSFSTEWKFQAMANIGLAVHL